MSDAEIKPLIVRSSPHITGGEGVQRIMRDVIIALLPVCGFAVYAFGIGVLLTLGVALAVCWATERLFCRISAKPSTLRDGSVTITALLYALTLPPALPLWMVAVGAFVAVALGKLFFGGLGFNVFNPALVGRAFLQAAFPSAMTTWSAPFAPDRFVSVADSLFTRPLMKPSTDAVSAATPLAAFKFEHTPTPLTDLLLGVTPGSLGETAALVIFVGGVYLIARNAMNWRIPVSILLSVFIAGGICHYVDATRYAAPLFLCLSGGLALGAVFMATDMVSAPLTHTGCIVYGIIIGILVVVIRNWGGLPEGVMYAILLGNALVPHIDAWTQPRPFGAGKTRDGAR